MPTPPKFGRDFFDCPHCQEFTRHYWSGTYLTQAHYPQDPVSVAVCGKCGESTVWRENKMVYPVESEATKQANGS
jgi:hypothetical protein